MSFLTQLTVEGSVLSSNPLGKLQATDSHPDEVAKRAVADTSIGRFTRPQGDADLVGAAGLGERAGNLPDTDIVIDGELVKRL